MMVGMLLNYIKRMPIDQAVLLNARPRAMKRLQHFNLYSKWKLHIPFGGESLEWSNTHKWYFDRKLKPNQYSL